jgi:glycosyltransferase involved in cell wall biosynthesis
MLSIIIPVLDEAENLPQLVRELDRVADAHAYELQIVIADDGSTDGSWRVISQLAEHDSRILGIRFRRNFGKAAALSAGRRRPNHHHGRRWPGRSSRNRRPPD